MKKAYGTQGAPLIEATYRIPEGGKREKGVESLFKEIVAENFPNLGRDLDIQVFEANRSKQNFNSKQSPRYITITLSKIKERILKAAENFETYTRKLPYSYQQISQQKPCTVF